MPRSLRLVVVLAPLLAAMTGCSEGVDPTLGTEQAFTIWGYLDPTADQQAIRVVPISGRIDASPTEADAEVTVTDLASGETIAFRDSAVTFDNGTTGHVFVADWTPQFRQTYRLEARRTTDGALATVDVEIPSRVDARVGEAVSTLSDVTYPFTFGGADNVFGVRIDLFVTGHPNAPADTSRLEVPFPAGRGTGGQIDVAFVSTVRAFLAQERLVGAGLALVRAELVAFVANEEWDVPSGRFDDLDAIVEPGTVSNVSGGFGFVGGGYYTRTSWTPSVPTQIRAGFGSAEDAASRLWINEMSVSENWVELYNPLNESIDVGDYSFSNAPTNGDVTTLPPNTRVPARSFFVVDLTFDLEPFTTLFFFGDNEALVLERNVEEVASGQTYGSYPDGRQYIVRISSEDVQDFMGGSLVPTRGEPNVPSPRYALLNELYTEGEGWAEALVFDPPTAETSVKAVWVLTEDSDMRSYLPAASSPVEGLVVADESAANGLELPQTGGEVFVLVEYVTSPDPTALSLYRVMDYRQYGLQAAGQSEGRLPDGGAWQRGLTPTRGASNSNSRPF